MAKVDQTRMDKVPETDNSTMTSTVLQVFQELIFSPVNLALLSLSLYLIYKIAQDYLRKPEVIKRPPPLPKLKKRDFTIEELKQYDGRGPEGRVLIALNGKVFDVTKKKHLYGPGGSYEVFAGRDASRGLGTFSLTADSIPDGYDDLSDLTSDAMSRIKDWESQFSESYDLVGKLLKPGEAPTDYSVEDEEEPNSRTSVSGGQSNGREEVKKTK